jgi:transcriptional regulator of acetoin/glycerol metabolism
MSLETSEIFSVTGNHVYVEELFIDDIQKELIYRSWYRCRQYGLSEESSFLSPIPSKEEIVRRRRAHKELTEIAEPLMSLLHNGFTGNCRVEFPEVAK